MFEFTAHVAAFYASKGDKARAEHFRKLSEGRLSFLSILATRERMDAKRK